MIQEYHRLFDISFDVLSQKTQSEQEELKKSQGVEMSNIEREYLNLDKIIPKFIGKISYLTVPESMNNL